jgi:hypothetical protein
MFETLLALTISLPIIPITRPVYDTAQDASIHLYGGLHSPNRDLRTGFETGAKFEYLVVHPYIMRLGLDYSQANITDPFVPSGIKSSWTFSTDAMVYIGSDGIISYLGVGATYGINAIDLDNSARDSLKTNLDIDVVSLSNNFGYRVFLGLRFDERVVFEMSFQQSNPEYIYRRRLTPDTFSEQRFDGTFSVARVSLGYLIPL